jgi:uncharacterized membrane protein YedE/YeeE
MLFALVGGVCIGAAAGLVVLLLGRVAGITGIIANAWPAPGRGWSWRAAFVAGLIVAGAVAARVDPDAVVGPSASWPLAIAGGLLVGFGARYGGGCTSGHGVCGLSRMSGRSLVATIVFMATAMITVLVTGA